MNNDVIGAQRAVTGTLGTVVSNIVTLVTTLIAAPYTKVTHAGFMSVISANRVEITPKSNGYLTGSTDSTIASSATVAVTSPYAITCSYTVA